MPRQPSAAPYHDWNERITAECYRPNGWARILDDNGRIVAIVDNYRRLSFNMGPTLLSWLEEHAPATYARVVEADRVGRRAIAQAYGHAILPLCDDRDLRTQIRWGLADFRHRFGREAEGMWLPETAVDDRTLAALAEEGVRFTILAPDQIDRVRPLAPTRGDGGDADGDASAWRTTDGRDLPGTLRWRHPDDPALGVDLVVYDGPLSHDVAFGGFASQTVIDRVVRRRPGDLVSVACDGETFGHHHTYADRGVAHALRLEADRRGVALPRLADRLADHPPDHEATVHLSAWSCAHGVGRWREDCGCRTGGEAGWTQAWRGPLRAALDVVRDHAAAVFGRRGPDVLRDPWAARDAYVDVVLGARTVEEFARDHLVGAGEGPSADARLIEALTLLESQRQALLMYTSCGWFFNDLAGIETVQIMRYAACCCDLLAELGEAPPVDRVLDVLAGAHSNDPDEGDGRAVWRRHVDPSRVDPGRVAAHLALDDLLGPGGVEAHGVASGRTGGHAYAHEVRDAVDRGGVAVCAGVVALTHQRTRRVTRWAYAAVHLGGLEVFGAVRPAADLPGGAVGAAIGDAGGGGDGDAADVTAVVDATRGGERITALLRLVVDRFGPREFGLECALPGVGEDLLRATAERLADRFVAAYDHLRSDHHDTLAALRVAGTPLPAELRGPVELSLARRLTVAVAACADATDPAAYGAVRALATEARDEGVRLEAPVAARALQRAVGRAVVRATTAVTGTGAGPGHDHAVDDAVGMVRLVRDLGLTVDLDGARERLHEALRDPTVTGEGRRRLAPLARRLGVAPEPLDLPD